MLTVNLKTGEKLVFMDFYPCKVKDLYKKMGILTSKVEAYQKSKGANYGYRNKN